MAAPNTSNSPQGQATFIPQTGYGDAPEGNVASAQYRPLPVVGYFQQGYPPQPQSNPAQGPPPAYDYKVDQPAYNYPLHVTNPSVVVAAQPTAATATTTHLSPPEKDYSGIAICALVFSLCTMITCGMSLICLSLSIPALVLSIVAMGTRGSSQRNNAGISIVLNVIAVICTVVILIAVVTPVAVTTSAAASLRYCDTIYYTDSTYRTYCTPHSYYTRDRCRYSCIYRAPAPAQRDCTPYYASAYDSYCFPNAYFICDTCRCTYYALTVTQSTGSYCPT